MSYPINPRPTNFLDFLGWVDAQLPANVEHVYAIMDNLDMHYSDDLLFFLWQHPRWERVYQPKYAAYLNLIESWWKTLRSLALQGKKFETMELSKGKLINHQDWTRTTEFLDLHFITLADF